MEARHRARRISITFSGTDGVDDEMETDAGEADVVSYVCADCGHKERAEDRGEQDEDDEDDEG